MTSKHKHKWKGLTLIEGKYTDYIRAYFYCEKCLAIKKNVYRKEDLK